MRYKIDLHTHSIISHDGGITAEQYAQLLSRGIVDYIAITDHNTITFAKVLQRQLGKQIIIGEEIKTTDGEIIGLFLKEAISPGLSAAQTVAAIHSQGGLVYIPHPFEKYRSALQSEMLEKLSGHIDIIEVFNARARWRGKPKEALAFAKKYNIARAASSDSHLAKGVGTAYSQIIEKPSASILVEMLQKGSLVTTNAPLYTLLAPMMNRIKKRIILTNYNYEQ